MRVALALTAALAAALPVAAQAADGPMGAMQRGLSWAFRREPEPQPVVVPLSSERPQPMALADQFSRGRVEAPEPARLPPPPGRYRAAAAPPYQMFTPQVPLPLQAKTQAAAVQPASLYSPASVAQASAPPPPAAPKPVRAVQQAAPKPASPPPQMLATAPEPAPAQRMAAVGPPPTRATGGATRLYSVHRGYGMEPDAIPETPADNRYVLIGPAASGVGSTDDNIADEAPDSRPGAF